MGHGSGQLRSCCWMWCCLWYRILVGPIPSSSASDLPLIVAPHTGRKKVLVTGAGGFVGSHIADLLLARGDQVVLVDEMNDYYNVSLKWANLQILQDKYGPLPFYHTDICNETAMTELFEKEKPGWVCHMAARAGVRPSIVDPILYVHSNIEGTTRLLELSRKYDVQNFVFASSSSVYGGSLATLFDENQVVDFPISPYAATKKSCELIGYTYHYLYGLNVTGLRFFTVYGPRGRPDMAPFQFIDRMSRNQTIQQFGDGSTSRDYTYIDDIVDGVIRAIDRPYPYEIFNLGKGNGTKLSDFVSLVEKFLETTARIDQQPDQPGDVPYTCANVTKAELLLGYHPTVSFEDGIHRTVEWYKSNYTQSNRSRERRRLVSSMRRIRYQSDPSEEATTGVLDELIHRSLWRRRRMQLAVSDIEPIVPPHTEKKKILVTGAAGFVGSHIADHLLQRGDEVVIVDEVNDYYDVTIKNANLKMLTDKYGTDRVKIYRGDICDDQLMASVFETERPEWVCHMAARAGVRPSIINPFIYVHSNVEGTTKLLELSRKHNVRNFVFASSSSVYGGSDSTFFDEGEMVDHPISPYAATKRMCELIGYTYHHLYGVNVTGLRFFTVYGPRGRPDMAPFQFIDRISRGITIKQFGDGSSSRDYTYIDDIVDGVVRAIDRPYPYQIFNLGKGSGTKLSDFVQLVEKYVGKTARIEYLPDQPGDVPYTCANITKSEYFLGYRSLVPFDEGIRRTVEWYKEAYPMNITEVGNESSTIPIPTEPPAEDRVKMAPFTVTPSILTTTPTSNATASSSSGKNANELSNPILTEPPTKDGVVASPFTVAPSDSTSTINSTASASSSSLSSVSSPVPTVTTADSPTSLLPVTTPPAVSSRSQDTGSVGSENGTIATNETITLSEMIAQGDANDEMTAVSPSTVASPSRDNSSSESKPAPGLPPPAPLPSSSSSSSSSPSPPPPIPIPPPASPAVNNAGAGSFQNANVFESNTNTLTTTKRAFDGVLSSGGSNYMFRELLLIQWLFLVGIVFWRGRNRLWFHGDHNQNHHHHHHHHNHHGSTTMTTNNNNVASTE